jgi:hypothetical protein
MEQCVPVGTAGLTSAKHHGGFQTKLVRCGDALHRVVGLFDPATRDEYVASLSYRIGQDELKMTRLVAAQGETRQIISLYVQRADAHGLA